MSDIDYYAYEAIGRRFESQFRGTCTLDYEHKIKRGDRVTRIQRADNPMLPISGVACANCTKLINHA